jgi:AAHS family 4-hydroxybenzoate transporter-like MFS transporter
MTSGKRIDIKAFIDERPISLYQWLLVALCFLIVTVDGMDVAIMGFVAPSIIHDWGISRPAFGLVMSAAPIGLVIGALTAGPASDRIGRKWVQITSVFLFGVFTIATAFTQSPAAMALLRLLTGIGLGAAMPNSTTLLSEYAPQRKRALLITIMFTGFNLGSALIGFAAGWLIPIHGWRSVLIFGGALPLVLIPFLGRVCGARFAGDEVFFSSEPALPTRKPIGVLFSQGYGSMTLALWVTYFMGLLVIYLLTGWLPTLMKDAGLTVTAAANITAMFQIGGTVGAVLVGWVMDKVRPAPVISAAYLGGGLCVLGLGYIGALSSSLALLVFAAGFCMSGAQTGLNAYAPGRYPTVARATGVSWMLGMGRFGSIFGSAIGGALLGFGWQFGAILAMLAIPATLAAIAILVSQRVSASETAGRPNTAH